MTPELIELGQRLTACKRWRWMAGMLTDSGFRVLHAVGDLKEAAMSGSGETEVWIGDRSLKQHSLEGERPSKWIPDLSDPATLGGLIALVKEAWNGKVVVMDGNGWWQVETDERDWDQDNTSSFAEALVLALEAA